MIVLISGTGYRVRACVYPNCEKFREKEMRVNYLFTLTFQGTTFLRLKILKTLQLLNFRNLEL